MTNFCGKCGTQLTEGVLFCPSCGERIENTTSNASSKKLNIKRVAMPIVAVAVVVAIVLVCVSVFNGGGYKKTLNNYFKAYENNDPDLMYSSVVAQYWIDWANDGVSDGWALECIEEDMEEDIDDWDCGDMIKISYEIRDEKRATKKQLEELEEDLFDSYAYYSYERDEFSITDAYVLDVRFIVKGDEGTDEFYYPDGLLLIKEKGKWKMTRGWVSCSFYDNE